MGGIQVKKLFKVSNALLLAVILSFTMAFGTACNTNKDRVSQKTSNEENINKNSKEDTETKEKKKNAKGDDISGDEGNGEKKYGNVKGFLWEVKKGDATVYMYGSIHVGSKDIYPLEKTVEDAFDSADVLVGEIDIANLDNDEISSVAMDSIYTNGDTALDHLSEEGKKKLDQVSKELKFNYKFIIRFKPWYVGSILSNYQVKKAGYNSDYGIDMYFFKKAKGKKETDELESAKFQFDLLNSFSDEEQEKYFIMSMGTVEETKAALDQMFDLYKKGDEKALLEFLGEDDKSSNYYKKMILERNENMTLKIEEYLNTDKTYFVVAGLAHFIGEDGIVQMLKDKGYTVTRK